MVNMMVWTSIDDLDFSQLKEYELHLLTKGLEASYSGVERESLNLEKEVDYQVDDNESGS